jgi:hypothetical protein
VDCSKPDRTETLAAFVRICRNADRTELIRAILLRWPDITLDELWWGMKLNPVQFESGNSCGLGWAVRVPIWSLFIGGDQIS